MIAFHCQDRVVHDGIAVMSREIESALSFWKERRPEIDLRISYVERCGPLQKRLSANQHSLLIVSNSIVCSAVGSLCVDPRAQAKRDSLRDARARVRNSGIPFVGRRSNDLRLSQLASKPPSLRRMARAWTFRKTFRCRHTFVHANYAARELLLPPSPSSRFSFAFFVWP